MRCFVVGTGRCGTSTFYQAARWVEGWTAGHETAAGMARLPEYPVRHIEVDAALTYRIPELRRRYPEAKWVHLIREKDACVESLVTAGRGAVEAFAAQWLHTTDVRAAAGVFYDATNELIHALISDAFVCRIEELEHDWPVFCHWLGMTCGNGVDEVFGRAYNAGTARGRDRYIALK